MKLTQTTFKINKEKQDKIDRLLLEIEILTDEILLNNLYEYLRYTGDVKFKKELEKVKYKLYNNTLRFHQKN